MSMTILGLGVAAPAASIAQPDAAAMARQRCCDRPQQARLLEAAYRQSTVRRRGSVLLHANGSSSGNGHAPDDRDDDAPLDAFYAAPRAAQPHGPTVAERVRAYVQHAPEMLLRAARAALDESGREPDAIDHVVVVSCTGLVSPGLDFTLIRELGLRPDVGRTMIGFMGCHGAINGLRVADALAAAPAMRSSATVLLACVELCSLHFQYGWDPQQVVASALFADGAAAIIGARSAESEAAGSAHWTLSSTGSCMLPDSADDMTWTIGDHGFRMTLSPRVPRLIEERLRGWLEPWLAGQGLTLSEVGSWAIHPGGPRIIDAAVAALDLPDTVAEPSRAVLAEHGNMSSPTVLFILDRLRQSRAPRPCVLLAFGPGLVVEAALLR